MSFILIKLLLLYHYIHCICYLFVWGNSDHITKTMELYLHFKFSKQNLNIKKNCICERLNFVWMYNIIYVIHVSVSWFTVELVTIVNIYIYTYIYCFFALKFLSCSSILIAFCVNMTIISALVVDFKTLRLPAAV